MGKLTKILVGVGERPAVLAKNVMVGKTMLFDHGREMTVKSAKTEGKKVIFELENHKKALFTSQMKEDDLVCIK